MQQIKLFFKDFSRLIAVHYRENWWAGLAAVGIFGIITIYKYINISISRLYIANLDGTRNAS